MQKICSRMWMHMIKGDVGYINDASTQQLGNNKVTKTQLNACRKIYMTYD